MGPEKATRHDFSPELTYPPTLAARMLRLETLTYLNYEMHCQEHRVQPLSLDQWLKRGDERESLWRGLAAREDFKEAEELKKAREITRELAPKYMLDMILHHASIMNHDGSIIKDLSKLECPNCKKVKNWDKWTKDQWAESNTPTYDKDKLRKDIEAMFGPRPTSEHGQLYCFNITDVVPEYQPKGPQFPRFPPTEKGPCMVQLTANYWRFIPRVQ
jgi:hypothetical protein